MDALRLRLSLAILAGVERALTGGYTKEIEVRWRGVPEILRGHVLSLTTLEMKQRPTAAAVVDALRMNHLHDDERD